MESGDRARKRREDAGQGPRADAIPFRHSGRCRREVHQNSRQENGPEPNREAVPRKNCCLEKLTKKNGDQICQLAVEILILHILSLCSSTAVIHFGLKTPIKPCFINKISIY